MKNRVSPATAILVILPFLFGGAAMGVLLRSRGSDAGAVAPRTSPREGRPPVEPPPVVSTPSPSTATAVPRSKIAKTTLQDLPLETRMKDYAALCRDYREFTRKLNSGSKDGKPAEELAGRLHDATWNSDIQKAVLNDPEAYVRFLRAPENEDISGGLLSLLCDVVGFDRGYDPVNSSQVPRPILDAVRDLLTSGTDNQKLAVLDLVRWDSGSKTGPLIEREVLIGRARALLSDNDPKIRASAAGVLHGYAPEQDDRRYQVLQDMWKNTQDPEVRIKWIEVLNSMETPKARELLLKGITQIMGKGPSPQSSLLLWKTVEVVKGNFSDQQPEEVEGLAVFCATAIRNDSDPTRYYFWLHLALSLPAGRVTSLLEQAQKSAPTAELRANAEQILEQVRSGETRSDRLKAMLQIPKR